jgi:integrase
LKNELLFLLKVLKDNGYDPSTLRISAFYSEEIISAVYSSLNKKYSERTLKKRFTLYKAFELWLHEELKYPLSESWKKISIKDPIYEPKAVSKDEYYRLLKVITPENGMGEAMKNGKIIQKNYFKSWIVIAIKLALETGCRREELIQMKFEDIIEIKGEKPYLRVENLKVNRINGLVDHKKKIYTPIPISHGLIELLKELGINEYQNTARYLLAPEKTEHRNALMDYLTRAFTHFYKLINPNAELKFKNLRKTNLTYKKIFNSSNTTHSKGGVIEKHYEDKVAIARGLFGYQLFTEDLEQKAPVNYWA